MQISTLKQTVVAVAITFTFVPLLTTSAKANFKRPAPQPPKGERATKFPRTYSVLRPAQSATSTNPAPAIQNQAETTPATNTTQLELLQSISEKINADIKALSEQISKLEQENHAIALEYKERDIFHQKEISAANQLLQKRGLDHLLIYYPLIQSAKHSTVKPQVASFQANRQTFERILSIHESNINQRKTQNKILCEKSENQLSTCSVSILELLHQHEQLQTGSFAFQHILMQNQARRSLLEMEIMHFQELQRLINSGKGIPASPSSEEIEQIIYSTPSGEKIIDPFHDDFILLKQANELSLRLENAQIRSTTLAQVNSILEGKAPQTTDQQMNIDLEAFIALIALRTFGGTAPQLHYSNLTSTQLPPNSSMKPVTSLDLNADEMPATTAIASITEEAKEETPMRPTASRKRKRGRKTLEAFVKKHQEIIKGILQVDNEFTVDNVQQKTDKKELELLTNATRSINTILNRLLKENLIEKMGSGRKISWRKKPNCDQVLQEKLAGCKS